MVYVTTEYLLGVLEGFSRPDAWIARQVREGALIRLKRGFYLLASKIEEEIPFEQIANLLYGPSYVSLEWALSYYSLIPERVVVVTSVTTSRSNQFDTEVGRFSYQYLSPSRYAMGFMRMEGKDETSRFLMATPEKAVLDYLFFHKKQYSKIDQFFEDTRIEEGDFRALNLSLLKKLALEYKNPRLKEFILLI